ncbi:hypothetical protein DFP91_5512 [Pseudorhodoplanes sinuspersici]|uniref:Uncharacterized protein n=1 Tax=Pseudorhodoplanes sinuspersici TaxID=1235591 RepID=A0A1W6ZLJ8_9HYPH|nr:hypothetical protein CAK95_03685 [Pseudorhodoplanes sinuspersici]RKE65943.1 hypothetical protein DFP91_5512 [Pseudorhodoplanes sinuspersici]
MTGSTRHFLKSQAEDAKHPSALGIATLLCSIRPSLAKYCGDVCSTLIDECVSELDTRFGVYVEGARRYETDVSFAALVRLLLYVQTELRDELKETRCATLIQDCIDHLLKTHLHYSRQPNGSSPRSAGIA